MSPQVGFLLQDQVVPRLRSAIPNALSFIGCEDAEELIQDGTALAAQMMHNAEQAGKKVVRSAGEIQVARPGSKLKAVHRLGGNTSGCWRHLKPPALKSVSPYRAVPPRNTAATSESSAP